MANQFDSEFIRAFADLDYCLGESAVVNYKSKAGDSDAIDAWLGSVGSSEEERTNGRVRITRRNVTISSTDVANPGVRAIVEISDTPWVIESIEELTPTAWRAIVKREEQLEITRPAYRLG